MIVKGSGHHIAADAGLGQDCGNRGGEPHGLQRRVHPQGDPAGPEQGLQFRLLRLSFLKNQRHPLFFVKTGDWLKPGRRNTGRQGGIDIDTLMQDWLNGL